MVKMVTYFENDFIFYYFLTHNPTVDKHFFGECVYIYIYIYIYEEFRCKSL